MGRKKDISEKERKKIIDMSLEGVSVKEIAKKINRCMATVYNVLADPFAVRTRTKTGTKGKLTAYQLKCVKRAASRLPLASSKQIFEDAGVGFVPKTTRNRILNKFARVVKPSKTPPLTKRHQERRVEWAKTYMKTNFDHVIFTDECRATLDGPDGWSRG